MDLGTSFAPEVGVAQMGADYIAILGYDDAATSPSITLQGLEGLVVGVRGGETDVFSFQNGQAILDPQYDYIYVVVMNLTRASREAECHETSYTILTGPGEQPHLPDRTLITPNFRPPRVELSP
ncbi:MAG: hypothetical protein HUU38_31660 [Anaerolineales bacterium]|nr:hypothetical protein [Anaerolineales bacterium]